MRSWVTWVGNGHSNWLKNDSFGPICNAISIMSQTFAGAWNNLVHISFSKHPYTTSSHRHPSNWSQLVSLTWNENILVIVDHSTRFAQAFATCNKTARTVGTKICHDICRTIRPTFSDPHWPRGRVRKQSIYSPRTVLRSQLFEDNPLPSS